MKRPSLLFITILISLIANSAGAQQVFHVQLEWTKKVHPVLGQEVLVSSQNYPNLHKPHLSFYRQVVPGLDATSEVELVNAVFEPVQDKALLPLYADLPAEVSIERQTSYLRSEPHLVLNFVPMRKNASTGQVEVLVDGQLLVTAAPVNAPSSRHQASRASSELMANGSWYRVGVTETGIYKLSFSYLQQLGMNPSTIDPRQIKIYGTGGRPLSFENPADGPTMMEELPIRVVGEGDGSFSSGDFVLFYAEGPNNWSLVEQDGELNYKHIRHYYSDTIYYMVAVTPGSGKRITPKTSLQASADLVLNSYEALRHHELDQHGPINEMILSGREWFGELFDITTAYDFTFSVPGLITSKPVELTAAVAARSSNSTSFITSYNGQTVMTQSLAPASIDAYYSDYVRLKRSTATFLPAGETFGITMRYNKANSSSKGWLNFLNLVGTAKLQYRPGTQLPFRDRAAADAQVVEYQLANASNDVLLWDVTNLHEVQEQQREVIGNEIRFRTQGEEVREYVAFNPSSAQQPATGTSINNQNLLGQSPAKLIIIAHPNFINEARELGELHLVQDGYSYLVVTPQSIYNEFSAGTQDVAAIRNFLRTLYERPTSPEDSPEFVLLFGDASYDFKDRVSSNTNFVPSFQSGNSIHPELAFVSDDFYGFMDPGEGNLDARSSEGDLIDLCVGRLPVSTSDQAKAVLQKIKLYTSDTSLGDWRNTVTFIADDQDENAYVNTAEKLSNYLQEITPTYNQDKIYVDSYQQISSSGGHVYPDATEDINRRIEKGALVVNYVGHGGERGLAHEQLVRLEDIHDWSNLRRLPLFLTATCEFGRYDDPNRISAGEWVLLNPSGGGIALMTTTRAVYNQGNENLAMAAYETLFTPTNAAGDMRPIGLVFRDAKNKIGFTINTRHFTLLGDPALTLAYPKQHVRTLSINDQPASSQPDSLKALSTVTITGEVTDQSGNRLTDYNGILYPTIFDKPGVKKTLGQDADSRAVEYMEQDHVIYKGKATVSQGLFSFSFVVPKDISYQNGFGKVSYYSDNGSTDANGQYSNVIVGGSNDSGFVDDQPPTVNVYINDTNFVSGGLTSEDPLLLVKVADDHGINTLGNSIGHELTATLNGGEPVVLNEYYEAKLDDHRAGEIRFPYSDLEEGRYRVNVKVWDVANNSAEGYTEFIVANSANLELSRLMNYPNPFTPSTSTSFHFEHNHPGTELHVTLQIFDIRGKLMKTIDQKVYSEGSHLGTLKWDGRDDSGNNIGQGVYVYRLQVSTPDGQIAAASEKLVLLR